MLLLPLRALVVVIEPLLKFCGLINEANGGDVVGIAELRFECRNDFLVSPNHPLRVVRRHTL